MIAIINGTFGIKVDIQYLFYGINSCLIIQHSLNDKIFGWFHTHINKHIHMC